jgi:hypothetical protein
VLEVWVAVSNLLGYSVSKGSINCCLSTGTLVESPASSGSRAVAIDRNMIDRPRKVVRLGASLAGSFVMLLIWMRRWWER